VLHGWEKLWEERRMRVLRKILGPKGRKLRSKELLYQILLAKMGGTVSMQGTMRGAYSILVGKSEAK
jgi:hypothetical protein